MTYLTLVLEFLFSISQLFRRTLRRHVILMEIFSLDHVPNGRILDLDAFKLDLALGNPSLNLAVLRSRFAFLNSLQFLRELTNALKNDVDELNIEAGCQECIETFFDAFSIFTVAFFFLNLFLVADTDIFDGICECLPDERL